MIEFNKNVEEVLPYHRQHYIDFLEDATAAYEKWFGLSFQIPGTSGKRTNLNEFLEVYEPLLKNMVLELDNGSSWIVNHDDKDLKWFPDDAQNLPQLRKLFKDNNIPITFKGALLFSTNELLKYSRDLISYPFLASNKEGFLYKDLDISHGEFQVIIKVSGHLNIDLLSTDKEVLRKIVNENSSNLIVVKEYRSNSSH